MKPQTRISRIDSYLEEMNNKGFTTQPVALGNCTDVMPEFGRFQDVQRLFRLKRPTVNNLIAEGQIKSVSLAMVVKNMCGIYYAYVFGNNWRSSERACLIFSSENISLASFAVHFLLEAMTPLIFSMVIAFLS